MFYFFHRIMHRYPVITPDPDPLEAAIQEFEDNREAFKRQVCFLTSIFSLIRVLIDYTFFILEIDRFVGWDFSNVDTRKQSGKFCIE